MTIFNKVACRAGLSILIFAVVLLASTLTFAMDKEGRITDCSFCHSLSRSEASDLLKPLKVTVKDVQLSPLRGLFEVSAERDGKSGPIFVDFAKKYAMQGLMVKLDELKSIEPRKNEVVDEKDKKKVSRLLKMDSIVMGNPNASREIFVFTDPDCPYCRKMHTELQKLVKVMDVAVYVKLYPLPIHPDAYRKARTIQGKNSLDLLNKVFSGEAVPDPTDSDSRELVDETIELAKSLGIQGTPAILLPNGKIEVGYRNLEALQKLITSQP